MTNIKNNDEYDWGDAPIGRVNIPPPTIEQIKSKLNPWHHDAAKNIQRLHKLIMMLNESQSARLCKAMSDITEGSLVIDAIYNELHGEYEKDWHENMYELTEHTLWPKLDKQKRRLRWKVQLFDELIKCPIDEIIFVYQRVVSNIPSLRKLWFSYRQVFYTTTRG